MAPFLEALETATSNWTEENSGMETITGELAAIALLVESTGIDFNDAEEALGA